MVITPIKNAGSLGLPAGYGTKAGYAKLTAAQKAIVDGGQKGASSIPVVSTPGVNSNPNNMVTSSNTPNVPTSNPTIKIPNFKYTAVNDPYGAGGKTSFKGQNQSGLDIASQNKTVTDLTKIDTTKIDPTKFARGSAAAAEEAKNPGKYLQSRNDATAAWLLNKGVTSPENILLELNKLNGFSSASEEDKQNTARAMSEQIGKFTTNNGQPDQITDAWTTIQNNYENQKNELIKAGGVADKYKNFNEVKAEIDKTLLAAGQYRLDNKLEGMPSQQDIQNIATKLGMDVNRVRQIMEGDGWSTLVPNKDFKDKMEINYNRGLEDLDKEKQRAFEDMTTALQNLRTMVSQQQQDVLTMANRNIEGLNRLGALRGQNNTTSFVQGVTQVMDDAQQTVARLEAQYQAAKNADEKSRARLMDDYNTSLTRAKQDLDTARADINNQMGTNYNSILQSYSGTALLDKLKTLNSDMLNAKIEVVANYADAMNKINIATNQDIDSIIKQENHVASIQKDNRNYLTQDKGAALKQITLGDLNGMYLREEISLDQYKMLHNRVIQKGGEDLSQYGEAGDIDTATYQAAVNAGMTPDQAITHTVTTHVNKAKKNGTAPTLSPDIKAQQETPAENPTVPEFVKKIDQMIVPGLTMKDKQALGFDKKTSDKVIKQYMLKEYLKSKVGKDATTNNIFANIAQFENNTSRSIDGLVSKTLQQLYGTAKAMKYDFEQNFSKDLSDPADIKTFALHINQMFQNYGKKPDETTVFKYLAEAGVPKGLLGSGTRGKVWNAIEALQ